MGLGLGLGFRALDTTMRAWLPSTNHLSKSSCGLGVPLRENVQRCPPSCDSISGAGAWLAGR